MRRTILLLATACVAFVSADFKSAAQGFKSAAHAAVHAQKHNITITGTIEGLPSGRLYLVAQTHEDKVDTLGSTNFSAVSADFKSAAPFTLEGTISQPMAASIVAQGYSGGFIFLAEPDAHYTALLKNGDGAYIRGGLLQDEWTTFISHMSAMKAQGEAMKARYDELKAQAKFRSASRVNDSIALHSARMEHEKDSFLAVHDDLIAAYNAQTTAVTRQLSADESLKMYEQLGPMARATVSAQIMKERIDRIRLSETGRKAPDFTLPTLTEGQTVTLSKVKAKIKIVDFWASWCGPCRLNNPSLRAIYADYHDKGLEIISVSLDTKRSAWAAAVEKDQLPWLQASSLSGWKCEVAKLYNITALPAIFVIDEHDNITATNLRGDKLRAYIAERLK